MSLAAGAVGLILAIALISAFDDMRLLTFLPVIEAIAIDRRVIAFAMIASLVTGVLFSIAPAIVSGRVDLNSSLKDGLTSWPGGRASFA